MSALTNRVVLDISYTNFEYAITACLERCKTEDDCKRIVGEILRVMKIREKKEQAYRTKCNSLDRARAKRW